MVQVTIHVRPKDAYSYPGRIKTLTLDSSSRLEDLVNLCKLDTKKGIQLYCHGNELALNSSLASNNVRSGDWIETCACPALSAALSALLCDFNAVQAQPDRTQANLEPLLGLQQQQQQQQPNQLSPWPDRWDDTSLKTRVIALALVKKTIQRQDRFANVKVPACSTLEELYPFLQQELNKDNRRGHNSMANILKPTTKKDGRPTTCWQLLQFKLDQIEFFNNSNYDDHANCPIERFLHNEKERHEQLKSANLVQTPQSIRKRRAPSSTSPSRQRRRLNMESSPSVTQKEWKCQECQTSLATCMCLEPADCPFHKQPSCVACFRANHPIQHRDHQPHAWNDARVTTVLKALQRQDRQRQYCPEYASGPFALLCTLYEQMNHHDAQQQHLSLPEFRLKELAQPICRSNLYDHQAWGRNAFACMESLMERNLVRLERIPGRSQQENIYSLLPAGETLGKYCWQFQKVVQSVIHQHPAVVQAKKDVLGNYRAADNPISIVVDTREDATFTERFLQKCQQEEISAEKRELIAGDYLFLVQDRVCPLVIERKSWSDLADSVMGKGRQRLDCVRIDGVDTQGGCTTGKCQLCKMKQSGCAKVMLMIEGARCTNVDSTPDKCTEAQRCQYCRELQQRHGHSVVQETLEEHVLHKLQVDHGCFVHFTRSFNETMDSLLLIREILGAGLKTVGSMSKDDDIARAIALSLGDSIRSTTQSSLDYAQPTLTYDKFCSNARRRGAVEGAIGKPRLGLKELGDNALTKNIFDGSMVAYCNSLSVQSETSEAVEVIDLNESFKSALDDSEVVEVLDVAEPSVKATEANNSVIEIDSDDEIEFFDPSEAEEDVAPSASAQGISKRSKRRTSTQDDDNVEVVLTVNPDGTPLVDGRKKKGMLTDTRDRGPATPLILLFGLTENDTEVFKILSGIWKTRYQLAIEADGTGVSSFRSSCKEELQKVQTGEVPIVDRQSILFWLLYLQVAQGVQIADLRQTADKEIFDSMLSPSRSNGAKSSESTTHSSAAMASLSRAKRPRIKEFPNQGAPVECIICKDPLGATDLQVTPCGHSFHSGCLDQWFSSQPRGNRRCPSCNRLVGMLKDDFPTQNATPNRRPNEASFELRSRPPVESASKQHERAARLARFDTGSSLTRTDPTRAQKRPPLCPSAVTRTDAKTATDVWECSQCTYRNPLPEIHCEMCQMSRPIDIEWTCPQCTLKNKYEVEICLACGAPFSHVSDGTTASVSVVAKSSRERSLYDAKHFDLPVAIPMRTKSYTQTKSSVLVGGTSASKQKCGACGQKGHNRANATPANCTSYYDEEEIKRRDKKKQENKRKAEEASQMMAELQRTGADREKRLREAQLALASLEESAAADAQMRQNELKRLQRAKARAEKKANK